jgi:hypothetical protein
MPVMPRRDIVVHTAFRQPCCFRQSGVFRYRLSSSTILALDYKGNLKSETRNPKE